jgi:hypothetical protein
MRRTLRHPSAAAAGTEPPSFTREGHEPIVPAPVAVESARIRPPGIRRAGSRGTPARRIGGAFGVAQRRRLGAERLEVFEHDLVQQALSGIARLVCARQSDHAGLTGARRASGRGRSIGRDCSDHLSEVDLPTVVATVFRSTRTPRACWPIFRRDCSTQPARRSLRLPLPPALDGSLPSIRQYTMTFEERVTRYADPSHGVSVYHPPRTESSIYTASERVYSKS